MLEEAVLVTRRFLPTWQRPNQVPAPPGGTSGRTCAPLIPMPLLCCRFLQHRGHPTVHSFNDAAGHHACRNAAGHVHAYGCDNPDAYRCCIQEHPLLEGYSEPETDSLFSQLPPCRRPANITGGALAAVFDLLGL